MGVEFQMQPGNSTSSFYVAIVVPRVLVGVGGQGLLLSDPWWPEDKSCINTQGSQRFFFPILALPTRDPCLPHSLMETLLLNCFTSTSVAQDCGRRGATSET